MALLFPEVGDESARTRVPSVLAAGSHSVAVKFGDSTIPGPPEAISRLTEVVPVNEQGAIVQDDFPGPLFNDYGFVVRARSEEGDDVLLWMFMYRQQGPEIIIANDVTQTAFVATKFSNVEKTAMHDTPYINKGQNIEDYFKLGSMQMSTTAEKASWALDGRELSYSPPKWYARGSHAGVEVDLEMTQRGKFYYHVANYEGWDKGSNTGIAGGNVHVRVNGTIKANNKTYTIKNGHGVHERIVMAGAVPERIHYMGKGGSPWIHSFGERMSIFAISRDTTGTAQFSINLDDETMVVTGSGWVGTKEKEHWYDPKTKQVNPRTWTVWATTEKGKFEATITGYGRWYYTWTRRGGTLVVHSYIADAVATFTKNDGTVIQENQVAVVEYMRTLYNQFKTQEIESL